MKSTVLGYPRVGARQELTKAIEAFWAGRSSADDLESTAAELRRGVWETLRDAGLDGVPSNTFSFYDHVLDTAVMFGAVLVFRSFGMAGVVVAVGFGVCERVFDKRWLSRAGLRAARCVDLAARMEKHRRCLISPL